MPAERWWVKESHQILLIACLTCLIAITHVVGVSINSGLSRSSVRGDARSYFAYLPSLLLDGDLDLSNQFSTLQPRGDDTGFPYGVGRNGLAKNWFPIGPALLWIPGYIVGLGVESLLPAPRSQPFGYGSGTALATAVWAILLAGVGAELTRRVVQRIVGAEVALPATAFVWLGTPAIYYTLITPLYAHAVGWFTVALMLWLACKATEASASRAGWMWAGLAGGFSVAVRLQDLPMFLVGVFVLVAHHGRSADKSAMVGPLVGWGAGSMVGYMPQALTSYWLSGSFWPLETIVDRPTPSVGRFLEILFSPGGNFEGWIIWTPIVLPAMIGLALLTMRSEARMGQVFAWGALVGILGILLVDFFSPFGPGAEFGGRRYVSTTPVLAVGAAFLLKGWPSEHREYHLEPLARRRAAWILLLVLAAGNLWLLASYELLVHVHGVYPTLPEAWRHAVGLGPP